MIKKRYIFASLLPSILFFANCTSTSYVKRQNFQNIPTRQGSPKHYQITSKVGLHLFGIFPLLNDAKFEKTIEEFSKAAKKNGAKRMQIIQKETYKYYLVYFPLSLIFTPVSTEIVGEIY
ncbi:MAG: hypothetical protein H7A23_04990 [Leptospiraceae bacterium]|nr:hypothetical protein [Leptospiraceae bacterium]MCP5493891.1 hypothetical protein [Leptospiraceae bacterium]